MISSKPSKNKLAQWEYKKQELSQLEDSQQFELYLLANSSQLKKQFIEDVPYLWCHNKIGRERQFQVYLNELNNNQLDVKGFPYVDNMLQFIDQKCKGNFKIISQTKDLQRILEYHSNNKKLISIHVFDQTLKNPKSLSSLPKNKKIEIKASQFLQFKRLLYRKNYQNNDIDTFMNATRITNWDIAEVNQSRLVLKTLLVSKNDSKGKEDFVKLGNCVEQQLGKVAEYEMQYKLNGSPQEAIKWYTKQSFYHRLVNNTLKAGKGNPLVLSYIRFPVKQLYNSIKSIYKSRKLHTQSFQCYRGGRINDKQLQYFRQNVKGFIQMQGFLSCSKNKKQMQEFVVNCVFKIRVNNLQRDKEWDHGFCILDDKQLTQYVKQEEVLFNIFCVMEIKGVTRQIVNNKQVDVISLEYGSLASLLYQKKHNLTLKDTQYSEKCINNYLALKPYYDSITSQVDCFRFFGKFKQVEQYYLTLLKHLDKHQTNKDTTKYMNVFYSLGQNYLSLQSYVQAKDYFLKARDIAESLKLSNASNQDELLLSRVYNGLGIANKNLNKLIQAKQNYMKTIKLIQRNRNKNGKVHLATAYNNLALILVQQLQQDNAIEYYNKALGLLQGQQNETIANIHYNLGQYYISKQMYKQTIKNLIKSLQIYTKLFGTHKQTINCHIKLGEAYLKNGSQEYNRHFSTAMDMMKNLPFHSQGQYIQMKREIQQLKNNQTKAKRTVSSIGSYQGDDIFSFMNKNQEQVHKYLSKEKIGKSNNEGNQFYSHQGIPFPSLGKNYQNQHQSTGKIPLNFINNSNNPSNNTNNNSNINNSNLGSVSSLQAILFSNSPQQTTKSPVINVNNSSNNNINSSANKVINTFSSLQNSKIPINQSDKLRQLRGKNILDTQIPTNYQSVNLQNSNSNKFRYDNLLNNNNNDNISPYINNRKTVTDPTYQDAIDQKMAAFNQNDFINNLKQGRQKRNLIFG